jgi:hypothetical protein
MSERQIIHVWITKYVLTEGIQEADVEAIISTPNMVVLRATKGNRDTYFYGEGKAWHKTRDSAVKHANIVVDRKIKFLQKQLNKLMATQFV